MKNQQRLLFLSLFVYFIQVHWIVNAYPTTIRLRDEIFSRMHSNFHCSMLENDEDAVTSDGFTIPLNPISTDYISYGWTNWNGPIRHLKIIDRKLISPKIFRLKYLKRLEIQDTCFFSCALPQIPPDIQCLASSLIDLSIYDTKITHLPNEIGKLTNLEILKLSNTGLMSLPDFIGSLFSLSNLDLSNNKLKTLPTTIKKLQSLKQLNLNNNPYLYSIEPLNGLSSLELLDTRYCSIKFLPNNLPQLTDLRMSNNKLKKLIGLETLGNGTDSPKSFYFDMNHIDFVSPKIRHVKNLVRLNLSHNRLATLPSDILDIPTLKHISIDNNFLDGNQLKKISKKFNI